MKKVVLLILMILLINGVLAQEDIVNAGIKPGNMFYGLDKAMENFQLAMAGKGIAKARLLVFFAEERLAEAKELSSKNNYKHIDKLMEDYEENINNADVEIERARGIGEDVSSLVKQIEVSTEKHIYVLELVKNKVPDQAKDAIENVLNKAKERQAKQLESRKKAGISVSENPTEEELRLKAEELRKKEEELKKKEEQLKGPGLKSITGYSVYSRDDLLTKRMAWIFLISLTGLFLYFYYINKRRHE